MIEHPLSITSSFSLKRRSTQISSPSFEGTIDELFQRYLYYRAMYELVRSIATKTDMESILENLLDSLNRILQSERSLVLLFNESGNIVYEKGRNLHKHDINHPSFDASWKIIEKARRTQKSLWFPNAFQTPDLQSKSVMRFKILSVICVPILYAEKIIGVFYTDNRNISGIYNQDQCGIAEVAMDIVAPYLYNRQQNLELEKRISLLDSPPDGSTFEGIIGEDAELLKVLKLVRQVSNSSATVLIEGASGTGKELIAQAIHQRSGRRLKRFVSLNCAALTETLLESELFGHVKGAFTGAVSDKKGWFESADGGTIFFDEISEMSSGLQAKLLRVLQTGEFTPVGSDRVKTCDVRIIAATNRHLLDLVQKGEFRNDLYYRLNIIILELPKLVERPNDILLLAHHFINKFADDKNQKIEISSEAQKMLQSYHYPGNIRELENIMRRALLLCNGVRIAPKDLPPDLHNSSSTTIDLQGGFAFQKKCVVENFEKNYIITTLKATSGVVSRAAKIAQMDAKNFYQKMDKYNISASYFKNETF